MKVKIEKLDNYGRGICFINNKICFVYNALEDEEVEINIIKENKKYIEAEVLKYYKLSNDREDVKCKYYKECGGCNLLHLSYKNENEFKQNKVKDILYKFAKVDKNKILDILSDNMLFYRNKAVFCCNKEGLAYYKYKSHEKVNIDKCLLLNKKINESINILNNNINTEKIDSILIRTSNNLDSILLDIKGDINNYDILKNYFDVIIINDRCITNDSRIITNIGKYKYYLSSKSFFQVNINLTYYLYEYIKNIIKTKKISKVLDLYSGVASIGIYISDVVDNVICVDNNKSNIIDAKDNLKLNNINNIKLICDDVSNVIDRFKDIDLIIVDPPRSGLDKKTCNYLNIINSKYIIYTSCDVVTLARDLNILKDKYNIVSIKPFNMFLKSYHCEAIAVLERR